MIKVAAIQMASGPQVQANLMEASRLVKDAAERGAQLVTLPETFAIMGLRDQDRVTLTETYGAGPIQDTLSRLAKKHKVWIVGGTIPLASDKPERPYAASLLFNDAGECVARYDKMHLFDVMLDDEIEIYAESDTNLAGKNPVVVDTPFGKLGLSVCYDVRFPELYRYLAAQGAQIMVVPSAFTDVTGKAHWEVLLRARAIENLAYVIAPAQGGYHVNGRTTYGHSMIVDYWGRICATLQKGSGIAMAELDLEELERTRRHFPVLTHRCAPDVDII
ncbi:carbon-nitrogen hydrolase family protein [Thiofilum flexile]|uniref:carbon-nitrogen hydrolase family protein n=1 Tax=Thiofilum flexile TaxID=125627 RepID=UPI00036D4C2A|nr:carbon-nitrogen hydrolase family protein [Thiofilum flexile]